MGEVFNGDINFVGDY
jgi:alpha-amylase